MADVPAACSALGATSSSGRHSSRPSASGGSARTSTPGAGPPDRSGPFLRSRVSRVHFPLCTRLGQRTLEHIGDFASSGRRSNQEEAARLGHEYGAAAQCWPTAAAPLDTPLEGRGLRPIQAPGTEGARVAESEPLVRTRPSENNLPSTKAASLLFQTLTTNHQQSSSRR